MNPRIVGRSDTGEKPSTCLHCGHPFKYGFNVFTREGMKEISITGMCESCFDGLFQDDEEENHDTIADLRLEVARLRKIEEIAVMCCEHPVWNDDKFYGLMCELQKALSGP